ncbi:threonine/serine exporter family protein [Lactobacillus rodentium]|uniref:Membrane protein n=1 Tax=Lactobacillus rodentium TaxID=947835 RepID=A0A2Z6T7G4_9LACO|nr:threonine/serine exporter family protein [Lactobacillus rodentium]MCR1894017.1 threonine/serine exporter family protein [Lactobacillus rodentium]GBG04118.1 membrane protein [Lactobacillus rodentium]
MQKKVIDSTYAAEVLDTCLKAGRLMIQGGSEMYRVEDTMLRIARNAGIEGSRCFTTPTGIFMSLGPHSYTQITQIKKRDINLELVDRVNALSREFAEKRISLNELKTKLIELSNNTPNYPIWLQIFGAVILSCTLMVLFMANYDWRDFPAAALVGGVGYGVFLAIKKYTKIRFLAEFITAMLMGFITIFLCKIFPKLLVDNILIGALMTLVPGVAFTNALRDLFGGDILSGIARGIEALFTAIALGGGIGIAMKILGG